MSTWRSEWTGKKCEVAIRLSRGESGGSYGEAVLILCAALSALAADVWPGTGIDRKRFVQLLKRFSPPHLSSTLISVPILAAHLRQKRKKGSLRRLQQAFLNFSRTRVVTGQDVDETEKQIKTTCPRLRRKNLSPVSLTPCSASLLFKRRRRHVLQ